MSSRAVFGAFLLASWAAAQNPVPQFRTRTELIQVDVVVLDEHGKPVTGLLASDFRITDNGQPRPIETFAEIAHRKDAQPVELVDWTAPGTADNTVSGSQRIVVLVIHDLGLSQERLDETRSAARRVVEGLGARASMAVVFTSGRGGIEFTNNPDDVLAAIDSTLGQRWVNRAGADYLIRTLQDVARHLRTEHAQRKAIIAITEGLRVEVLGLFDLMRPRPGRESTDIPMLAMMTALRRSNVTLYAVDPRGRIQTTNERFRASRGDMTALRMMDPVYHSQESMWLTTEAAGGFAIVDTNDIAAGLERILTDLDSYYLLGFHAGQTRERWRELKVAVNRPGVTVRHRRGYWPGAKPEPARNKDSLAAAAERVLPDASVPLRISTEVISQLDDLARLRVTLRTAEPHIVEATVIAVDLDRKKAINRWTRKTDNAREIEIPIELRRGRYQLRGAIRNAAGNTGSVYVLFTVR